MNPSQLSTHHVPETAARGARRAPAARPPAALQRSALRAPSGRRASASLPLLGVPLLCLVLSGCCDEHDSATCGDRVTEQISSFEVTTWTGDDQSDANINFCVRTKSPAPETCALLDNAGDNFNEDAAETFVVAIPVAAGDLDSFSIENTGGAILGNNEWEIAGLRVRATLEGGAEVLLYNEPDIGCENDLEIGQRYQPLFCSY